MSLILVKIPHLDSRKKLFFFSQKYLPKHKKKILDCDVLGKCNYFGLILHKYMGQSKRPKYPNYNQAPMLRHKHHFTGLQSPTPYRHNSIYFKITYTHDNTLIQGMTTNNVLKNTLERLKRS